jgi:hypothetical protein
MNKSEESRNIIPIAAAESSNTFNEVQLTNSATVRINRLEANASMNSSPTQRSGLGCSLGSVADSKAFFFKLVTKSDRSLAVLGISAVAIIPVVVCAVSGMELIALCLAGILSLTYIAYISS